MRFELTRPDKAVFPGALLSSELLSIDEFLPMNDTDEDFLCSVFSIL
jgi:hypothetical protein